MLLHSVHAFNFVCVCPLGTGVDVYILDTGINYNHKVFNGRASFGGYDAINDGRNGADCQGHGTHCAGLAVGRLTGVAYGARVYRYEMIIYFISFFKS